MEDSLRPGHAGHRLDDGCNLDIREPRTPRLVLLGQEEVPQALLASLALQLSNEGRCLPQVLLVCHELFILVLAGKDELIHERLKTCTDLHNALTRFESHIDFPSLAAKHANGS